MIAQETQFKLQAYLDGELPEKERADIEALMARDAEAVALFAELQNTAGALSGHEAGVALPETREFFWSKIGRQIERESAPARPAARLPLFGWVQRHLMPVMGAVLLACLIGTFALRGDASSVGPGEIELSSDDMGTYTYRDQEQGVTTVWLYDRSQDSQDEAGSAGAGNVAPQ